MTIPQPPFADWPAGDIAALLYVIDPGAELRYRRELCREAYDRGRADGDREGYDRAHAEMARDWRAIAIPASRGGPTSAELELRRWGPGGREHFADPRPGDRIPDEMRARARTS